MTMSEGEIVGSIAVIAVVAIVLMLAVTPVYNVWSRELSGKAELKEAEWNRQIAIEEAQARLASAELDALSEVERAKGVAEANKIIGTSLKDNSEYLIWRWIEGLHDEHTDVIYIPTEANIPIIEIGRSIK